MPCSRNHMRANDGSMRLINVSVICGLFAKRSRGFVAQLPRRLKFVMKTVFVYGSALTSLLTWQSNCPVCNEITGRGVEEK